MPNSTCSGTHCACHSQGVANAWTRRGFLKTMGLGATAVSVQPWRAMAGPFTREDFEKLVPADKKLRPEWVRSLTERGGRTVYRGADLAKIGMPIGGLCAGQIYLGGDGRLWHWDIFNQHLRTGADHYARPMQAVAPLDQGFALRVTRSGQTKEWALNGAQWREVSFIGEYPIGYVEYRDADCPATVSLEAFSPFVPLNTEDSLLPATVLDFTLTNRGKEDLELELTGWLENAVCLHSAKNRDGRRRNRVVRNDGMLFLDCSAEAVAAPERASRPDIVFDDFERETFGTWAVTGTAFGTGPVEITKIPAYQGDVGGKGKRVVNTHASAPGQTVEARDSATGKMVSRPFAIERDYITFLLGGGAHKGKTCIDLVIADKVVMTATGQDNNRMLPVSWDVRRWAGQTGSLQIVDAESGPWGNVGVDDIMFSDQPRVPLGPLAQESDFGTLGLALLGPRPDDSARASVPADGADPVQKPFGEKLVGSLTRKVKLAPFVSAKATFVLAWHLPNLKIDRLPPGRHYATRFESALAVARHVAGNFERLSGQTRLWHDTWYDSSLPYWFLDRTFLNTSILASSTCYRLGNGRFYGWEGVGCCEGTCGHVWQYAHAVGRLFPDLERTTREQVDFGLALQPDGAIHFRGEFNNIPAVDGQAGTILRALREHQMSADTGFLKRNWPRIKQATQWLIQKDANGDGLIETNQHNTLDTDWFGPVAWLSGLYLAALVAAEAMAIEMGDQAFADQCRTIADAGRKNIPARLFEDGYFVNRPDPKHPEAINSGTGCHIDQVFGQSWAFQVGLPRVLPEKETLAALKSLWRYNFTPDVGPYRENYKPGRWYAMPGEAGLLMCTFPRADWDYAQAKGKGPEWAAGYFNECMNGFEYQVAGHMIWEGMTMEGLAITRAVHDRYHASRRNPWNEVECGDHYARSMASYGVFLAACGYEHHGPKGHLGFAPRVTSGPGAEAAFKCPFTSAEGWGTYQQKAVGDTFQCEVSVKYGRLRLRTLALAAPGNVRAGAVHVLVNGRGVTARHTRTGARVVLTLEQETVLAAGQKIEVGVSG